LQWNRRCLIPIAIVFVALAARCAYVATRSNDIAWADATDYHSIARNLVDGKGFVSWEGKRVSRAPGYPIFLAGCYAVGLDTPRAIHAVQCIVGAATCLLILLLGRRLYGETVGLIAGAISAVYPFFIYYTGTVLSEILFVAGFVGLLLCLVHLGRMLDKPGSKYLWSAVGTGAVAGLLILLRSSLLLFPFFLLPFWLMRAESRKKATLSWIVMTAAIGVTLLPWVIRNYRLVHKIVPTTLQVGPSLYEANSRFATGGPAMDRIDWVEVRGGTMMSEVENNTFFRDAAMRYIRENPGRFMVMAFEKARRFWNVVPNYAAPNPKSRILYAAASLLTYVPVMLCAFLGLWLRREQAKALLLLLPPVLYFAALHMIFVGSTRYRTPIMPFIILIAAAGIETIRERIRSRRRVGETVSHG